LKFTPPPHIPSFLFGIVLADVDSLIPRGARKRFVLGAAGLGGALAVLYFGNHLPFPMMHDGLMMPLFGMAVLGLAGHNWIARFFGLAPLVAVGQASYCLYILHFNLWNMIHDHHVVARLGLTHLDPWLSYAVVVAAALLAMKTIERPAQRWIRAKFAESR
jgi:peptidoglycan/LPS O-acetylase OafA/YrhL